MPNKERFPADLPKMVFQETSKNGRFLVTVWNDSDSNALYRQMEGFGMPATGTLRIYDIASLKLVHSQSNLPLSDGLAKGEGLSASELEYYSSLLGKT